MRPEHAKLLLDRKVRQSELCSAQSTAYNLGGHLQALLLQYVPEPKEREDLYHDDWCD